MSRPAWATCPYCGTRRCTCPRPTAADVAHVAAIGRATLWAATHPRTAAWVGAWRIVGWRLWQWPGWVRRLRRMQEWMD